MHFFLMCFTSLHVLRSEINTLKKCIKLVINMNCTEMHGLQNIKGRSVEPGSNMAASRQHNSHPQQGYFRDDMGSETSRKYRCSRRQLCWPEVMFHWKRIDHDGGRRGFRGGERSSMSCGGAMNWWTQLKY